MAELKPYKGGYYLWLYVPSLGAAVSFLLLFSIATVLHIYRMINMRTWFCIPFVIGGICKYTVSVYTVLLIKTLIPIQLNYMVSGEGARHITIRRLYFPMPSRTTEFFLRRLFLPLPST